LYTAKNCQLVVMSLKPGEDIGAEVHKLDQFFRVEEGEGKAVLDGVEHRIKPKNAGAQPSAPSAQPASGANGPNVIDFGANGLRTVAGNENDSDVATVRANPLGTNPLSGADGADAKSPPQSAAGGTETPGWRGRV
jgi:hypothetical protein